VARAKIVIESVLGDVRQSDGTWLFHLVEQPKLGYIRLTSFAERTADDFRTALDQVRDSQCDGLILDLRGNEGGLLKTAVEVGDMLLEEGLIVSTRGRGAVEKSAHYAHPGADLPTDFPLVVLVDRFAASASEIVAAALQDHGRAVIVGERTWGKGTVQNIEELEGGKSAIRLTIATYWRPSGKDIHKRRNAKDSDDWGVRPDPEMDVVLAKELYEKAVKTRRKRDVTPLSELKALPRSETSIEPPATQNEPQTPPATDPTEVPPPVPDASEDSPASKAKEEPINLFYVDPQLQKAIDVLQQRIRDRASSPKAA
jgi:carboxyl-terminal processing protease